MKVLTKYFKVVLCFMAFALCSFMFAFTPTLTAVQAAEMAMTGYNVAINAIKMPTEEVDYNTPGKDVFKVPLLAAAGLAETATDYTIRVVDPSGYKHDFVVNGTENDENYFTLSGNELIVKAKNDGEYKIIYIVEENGRTYYSNSYKVTVKNVSYELDFSTPVVDSDNQVIGYTKNLIKTNLAVSTTAYEIPVAYAKITGQDLSVSASDGSVTNAKASIKVTKDGAPQELNGTNSIFTSNDGKYFITPSEAGVYTVEYTFEDSANRPTKTYTINVEEGYVASDLKLASTPTMPTIELGKKDITLPKLTVNLEDETNVDVNVTSIVIEKETDSNIKLELANNNFKFDMTPAMFGADSFDDMVGNYRITYTVEDAYGKTLIETFKVDGVTVSSKPTISLSYNYDKTQDNFQENVVLGAETELKAEYASNNEIVLPAVYVEDAVTTDYDDFIIIRTIRKGSTYYYIDNKKYDEDTNSLVDVESTEKGYNNSGDTNIGNVGKAVKFKFNDNAENIEGTYYVEYRVITKEVKERENNLYVSGTSEKYTFKVVASTALKEYTKPTIEITNLKDSYVKSTDAITVKVSATDELDTRLKNVVFTYSSETNATKTFEEHLNEIVGNLLTTVGTEKNCHILDDERLITGWTVPAPVEGGAATEFKGLNYYFDGVSKVEENETKNNFDLDLSRKTGTVNVVAATINDGGYVGTNSKVLTIKDTNDSVAPELKIYEADSIWKDGSNITEFTVGQGVDVKLPEIYVIDTDKTLSLNVMYYIDSPENSYGAITYKSPIGKNFYYDNTIVTGTEVQVIDGGTITTSETGVYYVAYTATDVAGNTSVMYFSFIVEDTSKPILSVEPVGDDITQTGNTIEGGKGTVIDFETTLRSADGKNDYTSDENITITVDDNGKGLDYQLSGNSRTSYVFNDYGTYVVTISGKYNDLEADSKVIKVNITKQEIKWLGEFDVPQYASKGETVKLPDVAASNGAVVTVKVVAPGSNESEAVEAVKKTDANGYSYWEFTTSETSKGTYTVIYTATNDEDTLVEKKSIKVGDNVAPTLTFNRGDLTQDLVYDGVNDIEYVVEMNKSKKTFVVKAINNGKEIYSYNIGLTISDKDDLGTVNTNMSWSNLSFELTGDHVTTGETTSTSTQYLISGTGKYSLKLTIKDSYDNTRTETIDFKVVSESSIDENKDTVIGAVLIVVSLVLLAGVILFFTFTGKKGGAKKVKTSKKEKVAKTTKAETTETAKVEETEVVEEKEEVKAEETQVSEEVVEEKVDEEPKTGDVE